MQQSIGARNLYYEKPRYRSMGKNQNRLTPKASMSQSSTTKKILVRGNIGKARSEEDKKVARSLHYSNMDGVLSSASSSILSSFLTPFALDLKATPTDIGVMASAHNLAYTASQIPGAKATEIWGRKKIWLASRILSRVVFLIPLILVPFLGLQNPVLWVILFSSLIYFSMGFSTPAWTSIIGDLVSPEIRGRYFGKRNMLMGVSSIIATVAAGYVLSLYGFPMIFILFAVLGMLSIPFFMKMYEKPFRPVFHYKHRFALNPGQWAPAIRANRGLAIFTTYLVFMNFAVMIAAPFYAVYMLRELHMGYALFASLITLGVAARIISFKYWGRLNDKFGSRRTLIVTAFLAVFIPLFWLFAGDALAVAAIMIIDGLIWAGFDLVTFNYLLDITPAERRPQYVANHNFFAGLGVMLGALAGAILASSVEGDVFFALSGLQIIFLLSFILRAACLVILPKIPEIDVSHQIAPVRYVFWQAVAVEPFRNIHNAVQFTFHYPYEIRKKFSREIQTIGYKIKMMRS